MAIWMVRHGETEWSISGQHTGSTDIPLTPGGRLQATAIGKLLAGRRFDHVFSSPMLRARETAGLAGFGDRIRLHDGLLEYDYGEFEGLTTGQIRSTHPGWRLFRDGCPGGETPEEVAARVDRMLARRGDLPGSWLLVGHGKSLRALAARWIDSGVALGSALPLEPAAISVLDREGAAPVLRLWNFTGAPDG